MSTANTNKYTVGETSSATSTPRKRPKCVKRTISVARVEQMLEEDRKERRNAPDKPLHFARDSLFSSSSGYTNYRGFLNLAILLLVLSNARVALENIIKYGILVDPFQWVQMFVKNPYSWPSATLLLAMNIYIVVALMIEVFQSKGRLPDNIAFWLKVINMVSMILIPAIVILRINPNPFGACFACGFHTTVFFKLWSYHQVNRWCREEQIKRKRITRRGSIDLSLYRSGESDSDTTKSEKLVYYPENLTLKDLYYFILAPTLCYELNFPRSRRIRKGFLLRRIVEMVFLSNLVLMLTQQWLLPTINNSMQPINSMNFGRMTERLLKLSVPNHVIWLICFYCIFHSSMNVSAELLRFSDRQFYLDWWNAPTVSDFWNRWNMPVHKWALRHVYRPMLRSGLTKLQAAVAVFLLSAFFHEYLVSVPLNMFRVWAFMGMMLQIPYAVMVAKIANVDWRLGNMAVWLSLIIGQPIAILMYVHDYYILQFRDKQDASV
ncbi:PREDICTED: diacylglycerol O-acyltransferase 1-like [Priapulus caudatus]|uniref:O-acyltransferase n=1 Tax=Priapulus caudatus TaxID=37621 RepID=A0ABM1EC42_PRICU|nr:PREDICTED: diacylglycerol O-acyltransferase 1-like [Priapulus caudatus]